MIDVHGIELRLNARVDATMSMMALTNIVATGTSRERRR